MAKKTGNTKTNGLDFTEGRIMPLLIRFTIPLLIGDVFQQFYNLTDSVIVGRFVGKEALAAVGSTGTLINSVIGLFLGCSVGAGIIISQRFGARDKDGLFRAIHTTAALTILMAVCFTVIGTMMAPEMLRWMSTPEDVFDIALTYLRIYFLGVSGLVFYNMSSGILRALGDSKRPIYALIIAAAINVLLDLLFVIIFRWGVQGVAFATICAQFGAAVYLIRLLCANKSNAGLRVKSIRLYHDSAQQILWVGIPIGMQRMITAMSNTIVQSHINVFGSDCMAGWAVYNKAHQFAVLPMDNIGSAVTTFVGQNYGAQKWNRIKVGVKNAALLNCCVTLFISVLLYVFAYQFAKVFSDAIGVITYGGMFLRLIALFVPVASIFKTYANVIRGFGNGKGAMVIMLLGLVATRQVYLFIIDHFSPTIKMVAASYPIGWISASILAYVYYRVESKRIEKKFAIQGVREA